MTTKILIIEDETLAAKRLSRKLKELVPEAEMVGYCDSIASAIRFLQSSPLPDLIMLDIQLGDGLSFDIFKQVEIHCPVIFTTAYDEYVLKAFELNSIDYLLKPINKELLQKSLLKFEKLRKQAISPDISALLPLLGKDNKTYKKRFLIAIADKLVSVTTKDIAYFCSVEKSTFIVDYKGMQYAIEPSLDKVEESLDPDQFFRINRQYIVSSNAIEKMVVLSKSRIKLHLKATTSEEILVSSARTHEFKEWMDK